VRRLGAAMVVALLVGGPFGASSAAARTSTARPPCPKPHFTGSISRTKDDFTNQPAAKRAGADMVDAIVYSFGARTSYTIYLADYRLDPGELGSTLVAPDGKVLVTMFLASRRGKPLHVGQRLVVEHDFVTVIVDAGGVAQASSEGQTGSARIRSLDAHQICFSIDYTDSHQHVKGRVRATIPSR
jgi:hypothetical protein